MTIKKSKSVMKFAAILSRAYCVILGAITVVGLRFMIYDPTNVPDFMTGAAPFSIVQTKRVRLAVGRVTGEFVEYQNRKSACH